MKKDKLVRYPGVVPFSTEQQSIFYGRKQDTQSLYDLVMRERTTLLYAKSGLGKSSLINAGLVPLLQKAPIRQDQRQIVPIFIRFGAYQAENSISPLKNTLESLPDLPNDSANWLDQLTPENLQNSLWYHLKKLTWANPKKHYLLIFDQFEELFSYPDLQVKAFKKEAAELIYKDAPNQVWKQVNNAPLNLLDDSQLDWLESRVPVKLLMAIREDQYSQLNHLNDTLPSIDQYRYNLKPLNENQARLAIEQPAQQVSEENHQDFVSTSFEYTPAALDKIIHFLSKEGSQVIETTQLQILCNRIEELGLDLVDVGDIPRFEDIFLDFYYNTLSEVVEEDRIVARRFIENELVQEGRRISVDEIICKRKLSESALETLVNKHMIRAERNSVGGRSYELAHDTLIAPVEKARKIREDQEAREKAEKDRLEEERRLKEEAELDRLEKEKTQKQLRHTRLLLGVAVLGLIVAIIAGIWAYQAQLAANKLAEEATRARDEAQNNLDDFLRAQAEKQIQDFKILEGRAQAILEVGGCPEEIFQEMQDISQVYPDSLRLRNSLDSLKTLNPNCP